MLRTKGWTWGDGSQAADHQAHGISGIVARPATDLNDVRRGMPPSWIGWLGEKGLAAQIEGVSKKGRLEGRPAP
jgi:hypothetical protein